MKFKRPCHDCGILTLAFGPRKYIRMAKGLARSLILHQSTDVRAIITDSQDRQLRRLYDIVIPLDPQFGSGVTQKIYLDRYTPFKQTLFIDSDCLVYADPAELWEIHATESGFGVRGYRYLRSGDSHPSVADMRAMLNAYSIPGIQAFNTGIIYFDSSESAQTVFRTSRDVFQRSSELGLKQFKNSPANDEPVFAIAMELLGVKMLPWEQGRAMSTMLGRLEGTFGIDVRKGRCNYVKDGRRLSPIVVHYIVESQDYFVYRRELRRLEFGSGIFGSALSSFIAAMEYTYLRLNHYWRKRVYPKFRRLRASVANTFDR